MLSAEGTPMAKVRIGGKEGAHRKLIAKQRNWADACRGLILVD